ncbi:MAG: hypothetical protein H8E03_01535 [Pelagibacteraceae bacterium]|nr:hypothetical protein [Pelagibacteraceae bacterium]
MSNTLKNIDRGLGDTIQRAIKTVTMGKLKPCSGCSMRRDKLNKLVPYNTDTK